ncbi:hypothetical protein SY88_18465 [Clostridiales bacterium PH28_bin88]|nr:hypothetical protein SY88_18465 [Clostridiales bacterium PH28_bin88]
MKSKTSRSPVEQEDLVLLAHGDGGLLTDRLVREVFLKHFNNPWLEEQGDAARLPASSGPLAITTDSFVVSPMFFPGGDIGKLAVCGTVNDLAASGARPLYLTAAFIIEEGLPVADLERVVRSMAETAAVLNLPVVAGDTKVVARGQADGLYINTTGVGVLEPGRRLEPASVVPGDRVLVTGSLGQHGAAILAARQELGLSNAPESDCAPLSPLVEELLPRFPGIRVMRDPTRGGVATTLKELAEAGRFDVWLDEEALPLAPSVRGITEMVGVDPLYLACEGRLVMAVAPAEVPALLAALHSHPLGAGAAVIGEVRAGEGNVNLCTSWGGTRRLDKLAGDPLPRIC